MVELNVELPHVTKNPPHGAHPHFSLNIITSTMVTITKALAKNMGTYEKKVH